MSVDPYPTTSLPPNQVQHPKRPSSETSTIWNPSPSPVTNPSTDTGFLEPQYPYVASPPAFTWSPLLNIPEFVQKRFDIIWQETGKQWTIEHGSVFPWFQDPDFRHNIEGRYLPGYEWKADKQAEGWLLLWESSADYWTKSRVIARWREEGMQQQISSWIQTGYYHSQTLEHWERIMVDPGLQELIDFHLQFEKARVRKLMENSERKPPAMLYHWLERRQLMESSGREPPVVLNPWQMALNAHDTMSISHGSPGSADSGVSNAASIKDALIYDHSLIVTTYSDSFAPAKRRYSSPGQEHNSRTKRSRAQVSSPESERRSTYYSPHFTTTAPITSGLAEKSSLGQANANANANVDVDVDAGAGEEEHPRVEESTGGFHTWIYGTLPSDLVSQEPRQIIPDGVLIISEVIQERDYSPYATLDSLSSLSGLSELEAERSGSPWFNASVEWLPSQDPPGLHRAKQSAIDDPKSEQATDDERAVKANGGKLQAEPIGISMTATEVVSHLVLHGCRDLTSSVDYATFSEYAISKGGFSDVHSARLKDTTRVAVKILRVSITSLAESPKHLKHAARELHTWSKCEHPNVLPLLGFALFRSGIGMVSPWMDQGTLPHYLERMPGVNRCGLCAQICDGLSYLHQIGIIHGDLKGANVLISDDGTPVLTDFGNSLHKDQSMKFTQTTSIKSGTMRWSAPELIKESGEHSKAADVYALAMTIYEVMSGTIPYEGKSDNHIVFLVINRWEPPERPKGIPTGREDGDKLWGLLGRCWSFAPEARPSASEVAAIMRAVSPEGLLEIGDSDEIASSHPFQVSMRLSQQRIKGS
ncbi:unnamed protein product [Rhizoctonia solani]|uniref:Protein kinase domain-containing protein n=1 Tax=Rhizoctonia solani TaxID=456999 RepID=A0A8H3DEJ6_9AGAM|nr:unnamed protein product [Rhizoctonia solani]